MSFVLVLAFALLLFTNSWGGYIGAMVSILAMAGLVIWKRPRIKYKSILIGAGAICLLVTGIFVGCKRGEILGRPAKQQVEEADSNTKGTTGGESQRVKDLVGVKSRRILRQSAWEMIKDRPIRGWGLANFFTYSNIFLSRFSTDPYYEDLWVKRPQFVLRNPGRVHNEYLSLAVELGFPGLLLFLSFFGFFIYEILKGWKPGIERVPDVLIFGAVGGVIAILVQSAASFPFRLPISMMFICTVMGVAIEGKPWRTWSFKGLPGGYWMAASVPVIAIALLITYRTSVIAVCLTKFFAGSERYENYSGEFFKLNRYPDDKVIEDFKYTTDHWHKDHEAYFRLPFYLIARNRLDEAAEAMKKLEYVQPYHEKTYFYWAEIERKRGDYGKAVKKYEEALQLEARYVIARILLVEVYLKQGDLDSAQREIQAALVYEEEAKGRLKKKEEERLEIAREKDEFREKLYRELLDPAVFSAIEKQIPKDTPAERRGDVIRNLIIERGILTDKDINEVEQRVAKEFERRQVDIQLEDVFFYWLHNSQAIIYVAEQEFDKAAGEFDTAESMYSKYEGIRSIPIYSYHANFDVFRRNKAVAESLRGREKPEDITKWTRKFYGASEMGDYDLLDKTYENAYLGMNAAYRGIPRIANPEQREQFEKHYRRFLGGQTREQKATEKADEAIKALNEMAKRFPSEFFISDGISSREPNFRMGVLYLSMDPPRTALAREAFKKALKNSCDQNIVNYNLLLAVFVDQGVRDLPLIMNVGAEQRLRIMETNVGNLLRGVDKHAVSPERVLDAYDHIIQTYPFYAAAYVQLAEFCIGTGNTGRAVDTVTTALRLFPTHGKLKALADDLGIPATPQGN